MMMKSGSEQTDSFALDMLSSSSLADIGERVIAGERLSAEDGLRLYESNEILTLGYLANIVRERKNGDLAYYIVNHHLNYTNICVNRCGFCAFAKDEGENGAYLISLDEIVKRADEAAQLGATEIHIVGGLNPTLNFDYYLNMVGGIHDRHPDLHIQAFTAVEIDYVARAAGLSIGETLGRLKEAGLGSLPGGGAEVFAPRVREEVCPKKLSGEEWLAVMREAHDAGLRSNATMLYGHVESYEERVEHLLRLRALQDETGGFMSFIPLSFHAQNTKLEEFSAPSGLSDLKSIAIGRLLLDNFDHIKAFWVMLGIKLAQVSLSFGADDMNGTVMEERITHAAGAETPQCLTVSQMAHLIKETGREPVERDTVYNRVNRVGSEAKKLERSQVQ